MVIKDVENRFIKEVYKFIFYGGAIAASQMMNVEWALQKFILWGNMPLRRLKEEAKY